MIKKNILIVGGTGFVGYHLAKSCLKKNWKVTSISIKNPKKIRYLPKVKYIFCDITKKNFLQKKIKKYFHYVVNLGGYVDHSNRKKTFESHYTGCKNLTEIFLKNMPLSFIQMGSSVEYGSSESPQKETSKCNPKSIYGKAKLMSTKHLIDIFNKKNFPSTVLRLYLAYGPKQDFNRFIPIIIKACIKNEKFPCSKGNQIRDYIHVEDVVGAIHKTLVSKNARGKIINIGSGKPRNLKSIIKYVKKATKGGHPQFDKIKLRKDEVLKIYPNINKAKLNIKWKPKILFKKGLEQTIRSYGKLR